MTRKLGQIDRIGRLILGALLLVLAAMGTIGIWGYLGVIFVGTTFVGIDPLFRINGILRTNLPIGP